MLFELRKASAVNARLTQPTRDIRAICTELAVSAAHELSDPTLVNNKRVTHTPIPNESKGVMVELAILHPELGPEHGRLECLTIAVQTRYHQPGPRSSSATAIPRGRIKEGLFGGEDAGRPWALVPPQPDDLEVSVSGDKLTVLFLGMSTPEVQFCPYGLVRGNRSRAYVGDEQKKMSKMTVGTPHCAVASSNQSIQVMSCFCTSLHGSYLDALDLVLDAMAVFFSFSRCGGR